jgi:N-acetylmuramoyl-L-alanine amidase
LRGEGFLRYFNKLPLLFLCGWIPLSGEGQSAGASPPKDVIVIDAGHGGKDPGAIGKRVQEKSITLAVALKLGKLISENMKDVKVLYTRDSDEFIELYQRAALANKNKADLFISVHCNANRNKTLRGAETYIMGLHRSVANLEVAKFENASILLESDYNKEYEGFDPNSDESYIVFSLYQNANLDRSTKLAATIQEQMSERVGLTDRGVRQAGFLVLYKTTMPSVLAEIGYLSNPEEEEFLISEKGEDYIASAIYRAVREYRQETAAGQAEVKVPPATASQAKRSDPKSQSVFYSVQVKSSPTQLSTDAASFNGLTGVEMYRHAGLYKYRVGRERSFDQAVEKLEEVKKMGYKDAFVIAFKGTERITVMQAKEILGR